MTQSQDQNPGPGGFQNMDEGKQRREKGGEMVAEEREQMSQIDRKGGESRPAGPGNREANERSGRQTPCGTESLEQDEDYDDEDQDRSGG